jgi:membrane protein YqaA with SNARE-associated domain
LAEGGFFLLGMGTFAYCVLSGLIPFVNAELYLLAASAAAPRELAIPLVLAATAGQMTAKACMYGAGRGVVRLPGERMKRWVVEAENRARDKPVTGGGVVFLSAASGLPPFYVVSIACGVLRFRFGLFLLLGFLGRFIRFGAVVLGPQIGKILLHH